MFQYLATNWSTILIAALVLGGMAFVIIRKVRQAKKGEGGCCGCSGCSLSESCNSSK